MSNLKLTFRAWPVITVVTIGLCYLTQLVASWVGITLPDQANLMMVKRMAGWNWAFIFLCLQVTTIIPALEELVFRGLLFKLPCRWVRRPPFVTALAVVGSAVFSAAHYIMQPFPDSAFLALGVFGLAQCWLLRKTNALWCVMLNHALFNMTNLVLLFIVPEAA